MGPSYPACLHMLINCSRREICSLYYCYWEKGSGKYFEHMVNGVKCWVCSMHVCSGMHVVPYFKLVTSPCPSTHRLPTLTCCCSLQPSAHRSIRRLCRKPIWTDSVRADERNSKHSASNVEVTDSWLSLSAWATRHKHRSSMQWERVLVPITHHRN